MHEREWLEPQHSALIAEGPDQNYVQVKRDFSDLECKVDELLADSDRAKAIARNGVNTFRDRYLTPAAQACYWRQLMHSWANVSFTPEGWETVDGTKKLRGTAFESFACVSTKSDDLL